MSDLFTDLHIFEMANNHQGDPEHGLLIIKRMGKIARTHGIKAAVKFQYRDIDSFIHPDYVSRTDVKHIPRFLSTRLTDADFRSMVQAVRDEGMVTVVTPFDEVSVGRCLEHGIDILKIASCSADDWPLLTEVASTGRPIIASTGGLELSKIDALVSFFAHRDAEFALMHCVGMYPTPNVNLHLNFIDKLKSRFPYLPIGWSGHEAPDNNDPVVVAIAKGAEILERHVGVPTDEITLNKYSMNPDQVESWVQAIERAREICGEVGVKKVTEDERESLLSLKRGVFARREIAAGETILPEDVFFAMPCEEGQLTSGEFGRYRASYIASRDYKPNEAVFERVQVDDVSTVRSVIHDVKGMLYEARIELGRDFQIELSHHYGIQQFRRTGAIIVNIINRDYCKKLIVVLPGQSHPAHAHKIKEETFQLLWGELEVSYDGARHLLRPGDKMLVEPGKMHSFKSNSGCIFEEISTTHRKSDSFYEDESISSKDLMERKTIIEDW